MGFSFLLLLMIRLKRLVQWRLLFLWVTTDKAVSDDESGVLERERERREGFWFWREEKRWWRGSSVGI